MGRFKLGALKIQTYFYLFFVNLGPLPKNSGPNPGTF